VRRSPIALILQRIAHPGFFDWPSLFMYAVAPGLLVYFRIGRLGWFPTHQRSCAQSFHPRLCISSFARAARAWYDRDRFCARARACSIANAHRRRFFSRTAPARDSH
jgi:hypothetical protein